MAAVAVVLLIDDQALRRLGVLGLGTGPLDETAHLLGGVLIAAALARSLACPLAAGLLAGSVFIDADHVPALLGADWVTRGTDRPYSHSLLTLALLAFGALAWPARRALLGGALVGVAGHLYRDLSESGAGVPLLWPWSLRSYTFPHWTYLAAQGLIVVVALARAGLSQPAGRGTARTMTVAPRSVPPEPGGTAH